MTGATHAVLAQVIAAAVWPGAPVQVYLCAIVGGLAPDLDSPGSAITRIQGLAPAGRVAANVAQAAHVRHRGPTHSLLALALVVCLGLAGVKFVHLPVIYPLAFCLGYFVHITSDMLTISGVPLFWPFSKKRRSPLPRALRLRTGGWPEKGVLVFLGWCVLRLMLQGRGL
jgi:inner membrane protein